MASFKKHFVQSAQDIYDKFVPNGVVIGSDGKERRPGLRKILMVVAALAVYTTIVPDSILAKPMASIVCITFFILCGMAFMRSSREAGTPGVPQYIPGEKKQENDEVTSLVQTEPVHYGEDEEDENQEDESVATKSEKEEEDRYNPAVSEAIFGLPFDPRP